MREGSLELSGHDSQSVFRYRCYAISLLTIAVLNFIRIYGTKKRQADLERMETNFHCIVTRNLKCLCLLLEDHVF
jgi:hypothetical protein